MRLRLLPDHWEWSDIMAVVVSVVVIVGFGSFVASHWDFGSRFCHGEYQRARTPADSARVDAIVLGGTRSRYGTCGELRRVRMLEHLERASPEPSSRRGAVQQTN